MNNQENTYRIIDNYLQGRMTQNQVDAFEIRIQNDVKLRELVELERATNEAIFQHNMVDLRAEFAEAMRTTRKKHSIKKYGLISITFLLSLGMVLFFTQKERQIPNKALSTKETIVTSATNTEQTPPLNDKLTTDNKTPNASSKEVVKQQSQKPIEIETATIDTTNKQVNKPQTTQEAPSIATPREAQKILPKTQLTPCPKIEITNNKTHAICEGETGSLTIKVKGGEKPYNYTFDGQEYTSSYVNSIYPGEYRLSVTDKNECRSKVFVISIIEKRCYEPEKAFTPSINSWTYESNGQEIKLKIMSSRGQLIFETQDIDPVWNGTNYNQEQMPRDAYIYIVEFEDGTNKTGTVTLVP